MIRAAMRRLHAHKTADYGNAWKKRGEVLSILANIARKVDRLEYLSDRNISTASEPVIDTYVDLFVYCLKYETFLADIDEGVARALNVAVDMPRPFSEGLSGFDELLSRHNLSILDENESSSAAPGRDISDAFAALESCFLGIDARSSPSARLLATQVLAAAALDGLAHTITADPGALERYAMLATPEKK